MFTKVICFTQGPENLNLKTWKDVPVKVVPGRKEGHVAGPPWGGRGDEVCAFHGCCEVGGLGAKNRVTGRCRR